MAKTLAACTDCGRSGVVMMLRDPPTCKRCYARESARQQARLRREIDAAHDLANRQQALRRAAGVGVPSGRTALSHSLGSVIGQAWRARAACHGATEVFFDTDTRDEAAAICEVCPVLIDCRDWSITDQDQLGFAGGLTEEERVDARTKTA